MTKEEPIWNVLTRTRGGTVSLLKNLTEGEARGCMQRLRRPLDGGDPWSGGALLQAARREVEKLERAARGISTEHPSMWVQSSGSFHPFSDGDLEQIDCWGPPGRTLEVWPKPDDYEERLQELVSRMLAERAGLDDAAPVGMERS